MEVNQMPAANDINQPDNTLILIVLSYRFPVVVSVVEEAKARDEARPAIPVEHVMCVGFGS